MIQRRRAEEVHSSLDAAFWRARRLLGEKSRRKEEKSRRKGGESRGLEFDTENWAVCGVRVQWDAKLV
jgi:hypothetical protein